MAKENSFLGMEIIDDSGECEREVRKGIEKFGYATEHNASYFLTFKEPYEKNVFLKDSSGCGVFGVYSENARQFFMVSEALAPREKQVEVLMDAVDTCFSRLGARKFYTQQDEALKAKTLSAFRGSAYRALRPMFVFYWPVFDMAGWDGDKMEGGQWKKLRNVKNSFYKSHVVKVVDSVTVDKNALRSIVEEWTAYQRTLRLTARKDRLYAQQYFNIIDSGFRDVTMAKTLIVDGVPSTITAGWEIPRSGGAYYSAVGVCNYRFDDLGEAANIDDLCRLKSVGYSFVDFGGSLANVLRFKLKFKPSFVYVTHTYAFVRK